MAEKGSTHVTEVVTATGLVTRLNPTRAKLFVATGADKGRSVSVGNEAILVGAHEACGLVLVDRSVSRRHAKVYRSGDYVIVEDLGSTNGTFYHDARVREVFVPLGQEICFGKVRVKIVPEELTVESKPIPEDRLGPLIGGDVRMREIFSLIEDIAASDVTVVIEGETGTGKELVAKAIHERSSRTSKPFVVFDCANQPKDLIESALFGHVKGAFTGATSPRSGAFERASGGSIFLDELGEFGLDLQPKLLRVLESREVQKVGGDEYDPVDVRVVAATNRNLKAEVRGGNFREDLYYRLAVVKIVMPSLRERLSDIPILVEHFLGLAGNPCTVDPASFASLEAYNWPGNVRELKNVVDRAAALSRGKTNVDLARFLTDRDDERPSASAGVAIDKFTSFKEAKGRVISDFESQYILTLLREHGNNISLAAREAGIDRKHFKDLMRKHGIEARPDGD